ncbi:DUF202 domain-containing protein [Arthrobacter sp. AG258]|uniref:DUF202 domain-containing protein n=1 Tax=Arthrobacter sp. AG258 TaxID=2183899 RepID=UPI00105F28FB|nr:DUF202 domain-containing protein [Arthrobacter sp. AG258]
MAPVKHHPAHQDSGLQPERTDLAWRRTALSLFVIACAFLRWLPLHYWYIGILTGAAVALAAVISATRKGRFRSAVRGINTEEMPPNTEATSMLAAGTALLSALALFCVVFRPPGT